MILQICWGISTLDISRPRFCSAGGLTLVRALPLSMWLQ